jgi:AP-2 complex subunit alpha
MVERTSPLSSPAIISLMRLLNLGVEHAYLDPSPHNEAGAAYLGYTALPGGAQQSVLCACRVEANPTNRQQFRVTVVSPAPALAESVHKLLSVQIHSAPSS